MFIFLLLTNKYVNPYKLIMIFGKKGSGKSTTLTKYAIQHVKKGWTVYSTERIPYTYYICPDDIGRVMLEDFNYVPFCKDDYKGLTKFFKILKEKIKPTAPKILLLIDESIIMSILLVKREFLDSFSFNSTYLTLTFKISDILFIKLTSIPSNCPFLFKKLIGFLSYFKATIK